MKVYREPETTQAKNQENGTSDVVSLFDVNIYTVVLQENYKDRKDSASSFYMAIDEDVNRDATEERDNLPS